MLCGNFYLRANKWIEGGGQGEGGEEKETEREYIGRMFIKVITKKTKKF